MTDEVFAQTIADKVLAFISIEGDSGGCDSDLCEPEKGRLCWRCCEVIYKRAVLDTLAHERVVDGRQGGEE